MRNLNLEESRVYLKIVQKGNMDDMAEFVYNLGWKDKAEQMLKEMEKFSNEFNTK